MVPNKITSEHQLVSTMRVDVHFSRDGQQTLMTLEFAFFWMGFKVLLTLSAGPFKIGYLAKYEFVLEGQFNPGIRCRTNIRGVEGE